VTPELYRRLARLGNLTAYRVLSVMTIADGPLTVADLARAYHDVAGVKVHRGRLRTAVDVLVEIGAIEETDARLVVSSPSAAPSPPEPEYEPPFEQPEPRGRMTAEEWRNSPEGIEAEAKRQAELDARDAEALARAVPMPAAAKKWLETIEQKQEREREEQLRNESDDQ
jgi:hypothetical protein